MITMIDYWALTDKYFPQFKQTFEFYGTHAELDQYGNEFTVKDDSPRASVYTMWHPLDDRMSIAEYGRDFDKVLYCIAYGSPNVAYGDRVEVHGEEYEVASIRRYNSHTRIDVRRLKAVST